MRSVRWALRDGSVRAVDGGARLRRWGSKCLQVAIVALINPRHRAHARDVLARGCANHQGSGAGTVQEGRNFAVVEKFLISQRACVRVWVAATREDLERGCVDGWWVLGDAGGWGVQVSER